MARVYTLKDPDRLKMRDRIVKVFGELQPKTELSFIDLLAHLGVKADGKDKVYADARGALNSLISTGLLNTFARGGGNLSYRWRQKGEPRHEGKARTARHKRVYKKQVGEVVQKVAAKQLTPSKFMVLPVAGLDPSIIAMISMVASQDKTLQEIARAITVEVSGQTLFIEYGVAKLVTKVA